MKIAAKTVVVLGLLLCGIPTQAEVRYSAIPIGNFWPEGMNNLGDVVGSVYQGDGVTFHSTFYSYSDGVSSDLGTLGGLSSHAYGINDSRQIVGEMKRHDGTYCAFLYENNSVTDLNSLIAPSLGLTLTYAGAINNKGQIAGTCKTASGEDHVFLYDTTTGSISDWNVPGVYYIGGLNNNGQITGNYLGQNQICNGFILGNGLRTDLAAPNAFSTTVGRINSQGIVVGGFSISESDLHTFLFNPANSEYTIFGDESNNFGCGINDDGQIVGGYGFPSMACIYEQGQPTNLNTLIDPNLGISLWQANMINNAGHIVAPATTGEIYLLVPIPEPSMWLIINVGLLCLLAYRCSHKKSS